MPHYDYTCTQCGHQIEAFQKMTDSPFQECPMCHQNSLKRGPGGGVGLQFQGSGFYITDYGTTSSPNKSCCPCGSSSPCSASN